MQPEGILNCIHARIGRPIWAQGGIFKRKCINIQNNPYTNEQKEYIYKELGMFTYQVKRSGRMVTVGVIGATGYAGAELMRLLCRHPNVGKILAGSHSHVGESYASIYPNFKKVFEFPCHDADIAALDRKSVV